jgi:hypothetical protein
MIIIFHLKMFGSPPSQPSHPNKLVPENLKTQKPSTLQPNVSYIQRTLTTPFL